LPVKGWRALSGCGTLAALACGLALLVLPAAAAAAPSAGASIIGGHPVSIEEFPSLVYIEAVEGKHGFACTGTVVAPRIVLTAAHCVEDIEKGTITPAATYALSTGVADPHSAGPTNIFHVVATHVFPGFDPGLLHGDAAILVLDRPTSAPPLALDGAGDAGLYSGGAEAQLTGWGLTKANAKEAPGNLQAATMLIQPSKTCREKIKPFYRPYLPAAQVCLLAANRGSGGCFGDSGGPAIARRADGTSVQVGVTSTGGPACSTRTPTVLTRADFISTWVSAWIAATESGAPPPLVDPSAPLPRMTGESAEEFAVFTLLETMGKRFKAARQVFGGCRKASGNAFRCQVEWFYKRNVFAAEISPFYLRRQEAVAWDSHYRIEWAPIKCIEAQPDNRRCPFHKLRG
jgi:secreted trypsin-like serine protease